MINQDELRKEVALQNGIWLGSNDPMLQSITIFEKALEQSVSELNELQEMALKALLNSQQKSHEETRRLAKKVVDEGTEYACDQISTAITATMDECREQIREDVRLAWRKIERARKITMLSAAVSSVCALIAVLAMLNVA